MAEIRTVTTLTAKREHLERAIAGYEKALEQARADLAHVIACIAMFERDEPADAPRYVDLHRVFARGEVMKLAKAALANGPLDTREIARSVLAAKGFDVTDAVLVKGVTYKLVQALRMQHKRGVIFDGGKRKGVRVWKLSEKWDERRV
jgi:hypothetical protein